METCSEANTGVKVFTCVRCVCLFVWVFVIVVGLVWGFFGCLCLFVLGGGEVFWLIGWLCFPTLMCCSLFLPIFDNVSPSHAPVIDAGATR